MGMRKLFGARKLLQQHRACRTELGRCNRLHGIQRHDSRLDRHPIPHSQQGRRILVPEHQDRSRTAEGAWSECKRAREEQHADEASRNYPDSWGEGRRKRDLPERSQRLPLQRHLLHLGLAERHRCSHRLGVRRSEVSSGSCIGAREEKSLRAFSIFISS